MELPLTKQIQFQGTSRISIKVKFCVVRILTFVSEYIVTLYLRLE